MVGDVVNDRGDFADLLRLLGEGEHVARDVLDALANALHRLEGAVHGTSAVFADLDRGLRHLRHLAGLVGRLGGGGAHLVHGSRGFRHGRRLLADAGRVLRHRGEDFRRG